jgi:hypothetical protein
MATIGYARGSAKRTETISYELSPNTCNTPDSDAVKDRMAAIHDHWVANGLVDLYKKGGFYCDGTSASGQASAPDERN